jgi:hypothetical protein
MARRSSSIRCACIGWELCAAKVITANFYMNAIETKWINASFGENSESVRTKTSVSSCTTFRNGRILFVNSMCEDTADMGTSAGESIRTWIWFVWITWQDSVQRDLSVSLPTRSGLKMNFSFFCHLFDLNLFFADRFVSVLPHESHRNRHLPQDITAGHSSGNASTSDPCQHSEREYIKNTYYHSTHASPKTRYKNATYINFI